MHGTSGTNGTMKDESANSAKSAKAKIREKEKIARPQGLKERQKDL